MIEGVIAPKTMATAGTMMVSTARSVPESRFHITLNSSL
jgi:hypothetical protein